MVALDNVVLVIGLSAIFQLTAGGVALGLIRTTGFRAAWTLVALATFGMAARRLISLEHYLVQGASAGFVFECVGLSTSALMLAGISGIRPIFRSLKRIQEQLRRSEERHRAVVEEALDGIYFFNPETRRIEDANPSFCRLTGYSAGELRTLVVGNVAEEAERGMARPGEREGGSWVYRRKDGSRFPAEVSSTLINRGGPPTVCVLVRDLTERRVAEEARESLIHRLEEASSSVRTLSGLLPICSGCKKIRDDTGYWNQLEAYISRHSDAHFSHGLCPECAIRLYPEYFQEEK